MGLTGEQIKSMRESQKISVADFARRIGTSRTSVYNIEKGEQSPSGELSQRIMETLGLIEDRVDQVPVVTSVAKLKADFQSEHSSPLECLSFAESIVLSPREESTSVGGDLFLIKAQLYLKSGNALQAISCAYRAELIFSRTGDIVSWCHAAFVHGESEFAKSSYSSAMDKFLLIESEMTRANYASALTPRVYAAIALCSVEIRDFEQMRTYQVKCDAAFEYVPERDKLSHLATRYYLQGVSLTENKSFKDAIDHFTKAEMLYAEMSDNRSALRMRTTVAKAYLKAKNIEVASEILNKVYAIKREVETSKSSIAETELLLAEIALLKGDMGDVEQLCGRVIEEKEVDVSRRATAHQIMSRSCFLSCNRRLVTEHLKQGARLLNGTPFVRQLNDILFEYVTVTEDGILTK